MSFQDELSIIGRGAVMAGRMEPGAVGESLDDARHLPLCGSLRRN